MNKNKTFFYFFIGTEAEFIKLFPVLIEFNKRNIKYKIIASGQNDISKSKLMEVIGNKEIDIFLHKGEIKQNRLSYLIWFVKTLTFSPILLRDEFKDKNKSNTTLILHGDTLSTVMGAVIGKVFRLKTAHIEAGLRSFNFLHPFPEEINRVVTSHLTDTHFSPNSWALHNLKNIKGEKINTLQNTLIESTSFALEQKIKRNSYGKYFICVIHRQENLYNKALLKRLVNEIVFASKKEKCIFVMHASTKYALSSMGFLEKLQKTKNVVLLERLDYFEFINLLNGSEYVLTDGGSNQEECYYLGKPCLILRNVTERVEGIGENAIVSENDPKVTEDFIKDYKSLIRKPVKSNEYPSKIIVDVLTR